MESLKVTTQTKGEGTFTDHTTVWKQVDEVLGVYVDVKDETFVACYMMGVATDPFDKRRFDIDWDALNIITNVATAQQLYNKLHEKLVEADALPGEEDVAV